MASVQVIISSKIYKNGTTPFFLQFIVNRVKTKRQIYAVEPEFIDHARKEVKKSHVHATRINRLIHKKLSDAKAYILDCQFNDEPVSADIFFNDKQDNDLIALMNEREAILRKQGAIGRANTFKFVTGNIKASGVSTNVKLINDKWVDTFNTYMISKERSAGTRGLYMATINYVFTKLVSTGLMKSNPLADFKVPQSAGTKEKYTIEEFNIIKDMPLEGRLHHVRQMFLFATMARGMRAFDVLTLRWENITAGRLKYTSQKSRKAFDIQLTPAMTACLEGLPDNNEYIFPFVKMPWSMYRTDKEKYMKHVGSKNVNINQHYMSKIETLSGISKHLTMHVARHTFSAIWLEGSTDLRILQAFLGHSDIKTTMKYAGKIKQGSRLDEAAEGLF